MHTARAVLLFALALAGCARGSASRSSVADALAIVGVAIIDPTYEGPTPSDHTILVVDGVIRAVGPTATLAIPAGVRRLDARGKFAIPGLWDTHVHFMNAGVTALIAVGRLADIVLLDADPLADIGNTRRIFAVVQGGRVLERGDLDTLLAGVRQAAGR